MSGSTEFIDAGENKIAPSVRSDALSRTFLTSAAIVAFALSFAIVPQLVSDTTAVTSYVANLVFRYNFHEVVPGRLYRSAEMPRDVLTAVVRENRIRTVIDLRLQEDFVDESGRTEADAARDGGARYVHIPLSSARADQLPRIKRLLDTFDTAETPLLVHCSSGTHRSGFATVLWLLEKEHAPLDAAESQISARYGFFALERAMKAIFQDAPTLDAVLRQWQIDARHKHVPFRRWLDDRLSHTADEATAQQTRVRRDAFARVLPGFLVHSMR